MRRVAGFALSLASLFLVLVAIMLDSQTLFYMGTALVATLLACRAQAWLAVRGLRFERVAPEAVRVGELVTVEVTVWSEHKIRRPLVAVIDSLPLKLQMVDRSPSLPVAPAYDLPVRTQYQFRALRRGKFRWSGLNVIGTDALGLITMKKHYTTSPAEMTVFPRPIPISIDIPMAAGWGISEAESGNSRGAGIEPRGIREYTSGDSLRHVHWRSSARSRKLQVKEFEAGSHAVAAFLLQRTRGTDIGLGPETSLDLMCGHAAYLSDMFLRQGVGVQFPGLEMGGYRGSAGERLSEIDELLASVEADTDDNMGTHLLRAKMDLPPGSTIFTFAVVADPSLVPAIAEVTHAGIQVIAMVYDAALFHMPGKKMPVLSAGSADFVSQLENVGAKSVMMPVEGTSA
ncbi:MAG: hypothetical protein QOJ65_742 [Fimbriimonadaceae bacterium]|jgi:uncharacterized protein (DUF58 family)|nr:hypothetical protein [Fimbriimonadaceae bacterium]